MLALPALCAAQFLAACTDRKAETAQATPAPMAIDLPGDRFFPESVTSDGAGTAYVPSAQGGIYKADLAQGALSQWIAPGAFGSGSIFGVLVDKAHGLLWACSNDLTAQGIVIEGADKGTWIKAFDLATGAGKVSLKLPGEGAFCNDMTVAPDGTVYVSDSNRSHILRWTPGADALEDWFFDQSLADPAHDQSGLDGIAMGADGYLYVNNWRLAVLARLEIAADGKPGKLTMIETSRPIEVPDAIRFIDATHFALAEGSGKVALVTLDGDTADVQTLVEGLSSAAGVTIEGRTVWHVPGLLSYVFRPDLQGKTPPLPFQLAPVALP